MEGLTSWIEATRKKRKEMDAKAAPRDGSESRSLSHCIQDIPMSLGIYLIRLCWTIIIVAGGHFGRPRSHTTDVTNKLYKIR